MFRFGMVLLSSGFPNELCVTPPKEREADFREVLADFDQRKAKPRELKPSFSIRKPYVLLDKKGVNAFRAKRFHTPEGQVLDERFQGATIYFSFRRAFQPETLARVNGNFDLAWKPLCVIPVGGLRENGRR